MQLKLERWGIDADVGSFIVRLVAGDVFIRVPLVGQVALNSVGLFFDRWEDAKRDPVL